MKIMRFSFRLTVISLLLSPFLSPRAEAQFGKLKNPLGNVRGKIEQKIIQMIGEKMGVGSPLLLDQKAAFAPVEDFSDFRPKLLSQDTREAVTTPLEAGDYVVPVRAFCTQWSIHAPGQGLAYKIAPLQGNAAPAIGALLTRGTLRSLSPMQLNAAAWRIQAGVPLMAWSASDQTIIHDLIPEYEKDLKGDAFQQIEATYNKYKRIPGIPSFEEMLEKMGEPGKLYKTIRRGRQFLANNTMAAERLPEMLYEPTGDGLPRVLPAEATPQASPWSEVRPGVFARFTVIEGNMGRNRLEFRVTPAALQKRVVFNLGPVRAGLRMVNYASNPTGTPSVSNPAVVGAGATALLMGPTLLEVLGVEGGALAIGGATLTAPAWAPAAAVGAGVVLIGYSIRRPAQALIIAPMVNWINNQDGTVPPIIKPLPTTGGATAAAPGGLDPDGEDEGNEPERLDTKDLPAEEREAVNDTLSNIEKETKPDWKNGKTEWNEPFNNKEGRLPGKQGNNLEEGEPGRYSKFDVKSPNYSRSNRGEWRIVRDNKSGKMYYTRDHYGSFYRIR